MPKSVKVLHPDGKTDVLDHVPNYEEIRRLIGGWIEHVRVLDRIIGGRFIYTSMFVDEEGLLKHLPRNEQATVIYQRNIRAQYPNSKEPFVEAEKALKLDAERCGLTYINVMEDKNLGYDGTNPHIAGIAVLFDGWTCEEVDDVMEYMMRNDEHRTTHRISIVDAYIASIRNKAMKAYAGDYAAWLRGGGGGQEPIDNDLPAKGAHNVRCALRDLIKRPTI